MPAICENGCGLFVPRPYGFRRHAAVDEQLAAEFSFSIARARERVVERGHALFQPGKEHSATLYPFDMSVHDLYVATCELVGERITLDEGRLCINLMPAGIDKPLARGGLPKKPASPWNQWPASATPTNLSFLTAVGLAAAPPNCSPAVGQRASLVSDLPAARGVLALLRQMESSNRNAALSRP